MIVDGYSGGVHLAPAFRERGFRCLHLQSASKLWPLVAPTFDFSVFERNFTQGGDIDALIADLRKEKIRAVIPGTETGVELADSVGERLGLPTNGTRLSQARRNKYLMIETCRKAGLPVAAQFCSGHLEDLLAGYRASRLREVVMKPLDSAGTDGVYICRNEAEIAEAFRKIIGRDNKLGLKNEKVLLQEFLQGTEYFVDTVSRDGLHAFTDIWRYQKRSINGHDFVYDKNDLCPHSGENEDRLKDYVTGVLSALNIVDGPAHAEVMMTENGPRLVEIGARLDGVTLPPLNRACLGFSPVDTVVDAVTGHERFTALHHEGYRLRKHASTVYLTSYRDGTLKRFTGEAALKNLPSFFHLSMRATDGGKIHKTVNYFTAPGIVSLAHPDRAVIEADYKTIREMERNGSLFELEETP